MFKMLKIDDATNEPELMIYFLIEGLGAFLQMQHRLKRRGEIGPEVGIEDEKNAYADQQTLVEILKAREGFAFKDHEEYMRWYCWWSNWHRNELTNDQWRELDRLIKPGKTEADFAAWRPTGDWRSKVDEPATV